MNSNKTWIVAIIAILALPALTIYGMETATIHTENTASKIATEFLENSPTYSWDGVDSSIRLINVIKTRNMNPEWIVTIEFTSLNSGYGDRTGQAVLTVINDHEIVVTVKEDTVVSAIIDNLWDEKAGREIDSGDTTRDKAVDLAIEFLVNGPTFQFDGVEESIEVIDIIAMESYPVQYIITIAFECRHAGYGDRTGQALAQVITPHEIRIALSAGNIGSAIMDDQWDELIQRPVEVVMVISPDTAKDIAVEYVQAHYPILEDVSIPYDWTVANLTPGGLVGFSRLEFTSGGWKVEVSYPVVHKPVYEIHVYYDHDVDFNWDGRVDHEGNILED